MPKSHSRNMSLTDDVALTNCKSYTFSRKESLSYQRNFTTTYKFDHDSCSKAAVAQNVLIQNNVLRIVAY